MKLVSSKTLSNKPLEGDEVPRERDEPVEIRRDGFHCMPGCNVLPARYFEESSGDLEEIDG